MRLRVLITNCTLASRTGTELYVRDLALELLRRGHLPVVYTPYPGSIADELREKTVPVVTSLKDIDFTPDVIHGHHVNETLSAILAFPAAPALFICHDYSSYFDRPPLVDHILRYIAVDETCRDRLIFDAGIPESRVQILENFVDLNRFTIRPPLPEKPRRALVFSNYARDDTYLPVIRKACKGCGISLDVVGSGVGKSIANPELILGKYDLVFAKAKAAMEAMAVGTAVILCDFKGVGALVTPSDFEYFRRLNFGRRLLSRPLDAEILIGEIRRYNADDARLVREKLRQVAGLEGCVDKLLDLYNAMREERNSLPPPDLHRLFLAYSLHVRDIVAQFQEKLHRQRERLMENHHSPLRSLMNISIVKAVATRVRQALTFKADK